MAAICIPLNLTFNAYYSSDNSLVFNMNSKATRFNSLEGKFIQLEECDDETYNIIHIARNWPSEHKQVYSCNNLPVLNVSYQDFLWINDYGYIKTQCNNISLCLSEVMYTPKSKCDNTWNLLKFGMGDYYNQLESLVDRDLNGLVKSFSQSILSKINNRFYP